MEPIRRFDHETYVRALESWHWLADLRDKSPVMASVFGDVFLQATDGSFWFLDIHEGTFDRAWPDAETLQAEINTPDAQGHYLMTGLLGAALESGLSPADDEVLGFKVPPIIGGEVAVDNLEVADFVMTVHLAGQIHEQVKDLPPGTPITGFTLDDG